MPARKTTTSPDKVAPPRAVVFIHASGTAAADEQWLDRLRGTGVLLFSHRPLPGCERTDGDYRDPGPLLRELANARPGHPIILLRAGLCPSSGQLASLCAQLEASEEPLALTALSNTEPAYNPFAGLRAETRPEFEDLSRAVEIMARPVLHPWRHWPSHLLALSTKAARVLATQGRDPTTAMGDGEIDLFVAERMFVVDERTAPFLSARLEPDESPLPPAWGGLCERLQGWLDAGAPALEPPGGDDRPVTLHVTHSWGGGVSLWTEAFIDEDTAGDHLQLRSEQSQSGAGAGQRLSLYTGNRLDFPIARWWLQPPIRSTRSADEQYRAVIEEIRSRFLVGRIVVSSLVGHCLDVFRTGLPTLQVLHDYFPLWPLLSVHPGPYLDTEGADLERALREHRASREFDDYDAAGWGAVGNAYLAALASNTVELVAPSRSVVGLFRRVDPRAGSLNITVIPHALPPVDLGDPVTARDRGDGRLRLLIPGRIQPGKGKEWLLDVLPSLTPHAHVYLVGTGKHGEDFFGHSGVSVVLQYERNELGDLLRQIGPHLAALLSVVPETYSYVLSELQRLRIPVIASRSGSFPERIEDGVTGWLVEPESDQLVKRVAAFAANPGLLEPVRDALGELPPGDLGAMVSAYNDLCPPLPPEPFHAVATCTTLQGAQAESAAFRALLERRELEDTRQLAERVERELERRSRWAARADRALQRIEHRNRELEQEMAERARWAERANAEADRARRHNRELELLVEERTAWAQNLDRELQTERERRVSLEANLAQTEAHLLRTAERLEQTRQALAERESALQTMTERQRRTGEELERLRHLQDRILASWSWRITRPLRVARRMARNGRQARVHNPLRWPMLLAKLVRLLATRGVGDTVRRLQEPAQSDHDAPDLKAPTKNPPKDTKTAPRADTQRAPAPQEAPEASALRAEPAEDDAEDPYTPTGQEKRSREIDEPPLELPSSSEPLVSIVIPAYNQWAYTRQCLESIAQAGANAPFETILVDDASGDDTADSASRVSGIHYLRNPENLGFIGSCNRGAEQARGEFLLLLNNDTEVTPGWLDQLLALFERVPDAGLVGAKLVYPDGRLQECGGMVFRDGSGWNYGRHDDPDRPEYQYPREVDYCSGACIMLRTATFSELGGFDSGYAPAYYEDTDLAFRVRELGQRVLVQPASVIIHHEGISSGTDLDSGIKRFQQVNREKFTARWARELETQPAPITDPDDLSQVRHARDHRQRGRVLVIDATTPEPDQDSGSVRLTNLMRCFQELGYGVTFFADNRMHAGRYTRLLQEAGVEVLYLPWLDPLKTFFEERGREFDFVFISRHYVAINYLSWLKRYCPRAPFIFDTVDLHYLREQRLAELEDSAALRQVARQTRRSELGVATAADATVVVSTAEVGVLAKDAPAARTHVLSNIHPVPGRRADFDARKDLFFVGGYQHPPNIDAAHWFVEKIWPLVRERLPGITFHLLGSKAPADVRRLAGDGVEFHGFVKDLEPYLDGCRLAVAPLRYGAGVKGKVNLSMSYGQPVVATTMAVEGMHAEHGREVLVADTATAFADEVVRLYQDGDLWQLLSDAAVKNVRAHFSLDAARRSLAELLESLPRKPAS